MKRHAQKVTAIGALSILAIGAALGPPACGGDDASKKTYVTVPVDRGKITARVTASGTLSPLKMVLVGSQVSGRILEIRVDFNSRVTKGEVIARIDPQIFQASVEQTRANLMAAEASVAKAEAQVEEAQRQYRRLAGLVKERLVAQADVDTAESNLRVAEATVSSSRSAVVQSRAARHQAELNLSYTTIVSPIDGVVISRNVDVGQTVASSFQAPTLFTIAEDLKRMQVDTAIAESDVGRISAGMKVSFRVDAYPAERFSGTVRQVRNAPQTLQNVVTYNAVIDVDNPELKLRPGMTANVTFVIAEKSDVLRVPNGALRFRPLREELADGARGGGALAPAQADAAGAGATDERDVYVLENGRPKPVRIRIGLTDGSFTEVRGGALAAGQGVITEGQGTPKASASTPRIGGPMGRL